MSKLIVMTSLFDFSEPRLHQIVEYLFIYHGEKKYWLRVSPQDK